VSRPVPTRTDPDSAGFFEAADRGELAVRFCDGCGRTIHLPRAWCSACGSWDTGFRPVEGRARLYSWTTVHHGTHPAFPLPYTVVLVELEEHPGVRFAGHLPGTPMLQAGMPMTVRFDRIDGTSLCLPNWSPSADGTPGA
jgi:uncharacterized OB-fold protein